MIELRGVGVAFNARAALSDISFRVERGETLGIIGAGGAGKTLILKLICGLLRPSQGQVIFDGQALGGLDERALMRLRGRMGMIFQNNALFDFMSVGDNIAFPLRRLGEVDEAALQAKVHQRLEEVALPRAYDQLPQALSGGMKKRVCLARATIHDPELMLCDDPTAGLDPVTTNRIFRLLKATQARNRATALIVSHEVEDLQEICDRLLMLEGGRMIFWGSVAEARGGPEGVREFLMGRR
ncbi:ATP-binding cassette domain-containing protein [Myxococcota bacterium]|nr:ATP-binding cassette domain-containing protein [Myxococcota bacterium]MBU1430177.1 ATP-binding cassette domain-containing protein [Myxococcota bacterium]MBU1900070.1 ATP-binding cassette domain-containing protein [Myxococcota bacterium]